MSPKYRGSITSLLLLKISLFIHPRITLAFWATPSVMEYTSLHVRQEGVSGLLKAQLVQIKRFGARSRPSGRGLKRRALFSCREGVGRENRHGARTVGEKAG